MTLYASERASFTSFIMYIYSIAEYVRAIVDMLFWTYCSPATRENVFRICVMIEIWNVKFIFHFVSFELWMCSCVLSFIWRCTSEAFVWCGSDCERTGHYRMGELWVSLSILVSSMSLLRCLLKLTSLLSVAVVWF